MPYLSHCELDDNITEMEKMYESRVNEDVVDTFVSKAEDIESVNEYVSEELYVETGIPISTASPRVPITLKADKDVSNGVVNISIEMELPTSDTTSEAIVRAVMNKLQDRTITKFDVNGEPGEKATMSACLASVYDG